MSNYDIQNIKNTLEEKKCYKKKVYSRRIIVFSMSVLFSTPVKNMIRYKRNKDYFKLLQNIWITFRVSWGKMNLFSSIVFKKYMLLLKKLKVTIFKKPLNFVQNKNFPHSCNINSFSLILKKVLNFGVLPQAWGKMA